MGGNAAGKKRFGIHVSALVFGIVAATVAVCMQVFGSFHPPQAYGLCVVCHARDLINTLFNQTSWYGVPVSSVAIKGLVLTSAGILAGAAIMAIINREWKLRVVENIPLQFINGFVVMTAGLIISGCPMRLLLRGAYGDMGAMSSILTLVVGVFLGTLVLRRRVKKL